MRGLDHRRDYCFGRVCEQGLSPEPHRRAPPQVSGAGGSGAGAGAGGSERASEGASEGASGAPLPAEQPTTLPSWPFELGEAGESCSATCARKGLVCDSEAQGRATYGAHGGV